MRLGDDRLVKARCRIISATNKELEEAVRQGTFRQDLYYRLNILRLNIPSLRERRGDIRDLARIFLEKFCAKYGKVSGKITPKALKILLERKWDGNIRELQAVIERYVVLCAEGHVHLEEPGLRDILEEGRQAGQAAGQARRVPSDEEVRLALEEHRHNILEAAAALGVHRTTLWRRLKRARRN